MLGKLFIVSTPIGNLGDITLRALETLKTVDLVLCEDTRMTRKLLSHYEIHSKTQTFNAHANQTAITNVVEAIGNGQNYALVSDAGTPCISDPGSILIDAILREHGSDAIEVIPGASALGAALVRSGFPGMPMSFMGFPPMKKGRNKFWTELATKTETVVVYESTHRIEKALGELSATIGTRPIAWCRELTKIHEETIRGTAEELLAHLSLDPVKQKGEHVLVIAPLYRLEA
jgi:16S rRNA (cytidine1402-2'-O)-methyltransferase